MSEVAQIYFGMAALPKWAIALVTDRPRTVTGSPAVNSPNRLVEMAHGNFKDG